MRKAQQKRAAAALAAAQARGVAKYNTILAK